MLLGACLYPFCTRTFAHAPASRTPKRHAATDGIRLSDLGRPQHNSSTTTGICLLVLCAKLRLQRRDFGDGLIVFVEDEREGFLPGGKLLRLHMSLLTRSAPARNSPAWTIAALAALVPRSVEHDEIDTHEHIETTLDGTEPVSRRATSGQPSAQTSPPRRRVRVSGRRVGAATAPIE